MDAGAQRSFGSAVGQIRHATGRRMESLGPGCVWFDFRSGVPGSGVALIHQLRRRPPVEDAAAGLFVSPPGLFQSRGLDVENYSVALWSWYAASSSTPRWTLRASR